MRETLLSDSMQIQHAAVRAHALTSLSGGIPLVVF